MQSAHFNVENMEMVMAVIKAAEEMNSPVIMQTTPSTVKYAGLDYYPCYGKDSGREIKRSGCDAPGPRQQL